MSNKITDINEYTFGDVTIPLKTSLAWNGEARSEGEKHEVTLLVNMKGVTLKDAISKTMSQKAVDFQRSRRSADSNGAFKSREEFDEYCENLGSEHQIHFSQVGNSPKTSADAEASFDQSVAVMSPEQLKAKYAELQKLLEGQEEG